MKRLIVILLMILTIWLLEKSYAEMMNNIELKVFMQINTVSTGSLTLVVELKGGRNE